MYYDKNDGAKKPIDLSVTKTNPMLKDRTSDSSLTILHDKFSMKMPMANAAAADTRFGVSPKGKVSGSLSNVYDFTMKQNNKEVKHSKRR